VRKKRTHGKDKGGRVISRGTCRVFLQGNMRRMELTPYIGDRNSISGEVTRRIVEKEVDWRGGAGRG